MAEYTYKCIIIGNNIYREVQLIDAFEEGVWIGTTRNCRVRFDQRDFFADFEIELHKEGNNWAISCGKSVYIDRGGVLKSYSKELSHGDEVVFKYNDSNSELLKIVFLIDFDMINCKFDKIIDISQAPNIVIGSYVKNSIYISDPFLKDDTMTLVREDGELYVYDNQTQYGVYVNGNRIVGGKSVIYPYDFIMMDGYYFYYKDNRLYTDSSRPIESRLPHSIVKESDNSFEYPKFNRSVRMNIVIPEEKIEILPPDDPGEEPEQNLAMTLIPSVLSLVVMMLLRSMMGGNPMFMIYCGMTMGMGIITSVITYFQSGKKYKQSLVDREARYTEYVKNQEKKIIDLRNKEKRILEEKYINLDTEIMEVRNFDSKLFEKSKDDDDFLTIRIGHGDIDANCEIVTRDQEVKSEDKLKEYPGLLKDAYGKILDAPVTIDLKECNGIGLIGSRDFLYTMLRMITVDIATRHFHEDVKMYYIFNEDDIEKFKPIRWFKHVNSEDTSIRNFMYNEESKKIMLEFLYKELSRRDGMKADMLKDEIRHVIFVYDSTGFAKHPVSNYIKQSKELGFTFIFFEEYQEAVPEGVGYVIYEQESGAKLVSTEDKEDEQVFEYDVISDAELERVALKLGCVEVDAVSLENNLTKNISLFKLLGIVNVLDIDLGDRWGNSQIYKTMAAPLGVDANNDIVYLDLNEKKHGPHGLVAGTTGSGKSEILQTYILSMATMYHPYEVGFVIIDFKGGGMVNQFKNLPHLIGAITNIDGREIDRSLMSIKAELKKRQALFAEHNVNHIDNYIKLFKNGTAKTPLPHIILIVDEFAELKNDQPEFMKELISAARIGRSLGVHLILATQKPSGVVDEQIWSNSKFKLCLKVQNKNDSNEVLKSPLAAEIKEPGRAYLQVGNNEIFELFQSAYSGADVASEQAGNIKEYKMFQLDLAGIPSLVFQQKNDKRAESMTQLDAIVEYINKFCEVNEIKKLQGICLPSLGEMIEYQYSPYEKEDSIGAVIGMYDDPSNQNQDTYSLNLTSNNLFILGSSQYGKTNILQVITKSLVSNYTPSQVNIYILDFASMILKNLEGLKHVGGVITASEDEKFKHFIRMIHKEMLVRKNLLAELGISSFSSYLEAGYTDLPQIVIMIDNFTAVKELYLQKEDLILPICRDGLTVGINVIVTDAQSNGLGFRYLSNFANRIALFTNNEGEYNNLFGFCRMRNRPFPGRGIVEMDKELFEFQAYMAFEGEKEIERVRNMRAFVQEINDKNENVRAKRIPEIPDKFTYDLAESNYSEYLSRPYESLYGINFKTVEPEVMNLSETNMLAITGGADVARCGFAKNIIASLERNAANAPYELYIVDDVMGNYGEYRGKQFTNVYTTEAEEAISIIVKLEEELAATYKSMTEGKVKINELPYKLVVIHNKDAVEAISKSKDAIEKYKNIMGKYKQLRISIILSNIENATIPIAGLELLKMIKEKKCIIAMCDLAAFKLFELPIASVREYTKNIGNGEGYYINGGSIIKCKFLQNQ